MVLSTCSCLPRVSHTTLSLPLKTFFTVSQLGTCSKDSGKCHTRLYGKILNFKLYSISQFKLRPFHLAKVGHFLALPLPEVRALLSRWPRKASDHLTFSTNSIVASLNGQFISNYSNQRQTWILKCPRSLIDHFVLQISNSFLRAHRSRMTNLASSARS